MKNGCSYKRLKDKYLRLQMQLKEAEEQLLNYKLHIEENRKLKKQLQEKQKIIDGAIDRLKKCSCFETMERGLVSDLSEILRDDRK